MSAIQAGFEFPDTQYTFDPEQYWGQFEFKVYVVTLYHPVRRGKRHKRDYDRSFKTVRARSREGAARTARANYYGKLKISGCSVRYATPTDLGCVPNRKG
jgi:hypothetical protein